MEEDEEPKEKKKRSRNTGKIKPVRDAIEFRDIDQMLWCMTDELWKRHSYKRECKNTAVLLKAALDQLCSRVQSKKEINMEELASFVGMKPEDVKEINETPELSLESEEDE